MSVRWPARAAAALLVSLLVPLVAPPADAATYPAPRSDEWWFTAWGVQDKLWPISRGAGVTVGVVDSGVQADLPELAGSVLPGADFTHRGGDGRTDLDDARVPGHGTAMAALISAHGGRTRYWGVAPETKILPVIANDESSTAQAVRYATDHGAKVINISLGGPRRCTDFMQEAVAYAIQHDVVVVAASGDYGNGTNPALSPADCAGVLAAGAVSVSAAGRFAPWHRTERQPYVAVGAPGGNVGGIAKDGEFHTSDGGASQASALTSAAVALVRSKFPAMPARDVVQRIIASCLDVAPRGKDGETGYGIVRVYHALTADVPKTAPNPVFAAYDEWKAAQSPVSGKPAVNTPSARRPVGELVMMGAALFLAVAIVIAVMILSLRRGRRRESASAPYGTTMDPRPMAPYPPPQPHEWAPRSGPENGVPPFPGDGRGPR